MKHEKGDWCLDLVPWYGPSEREREHVRVRIEREEAVRVGDFAATLPEMLTGALSTWPEMLTGALSTLPEMLTGALF
jgi:putative sterol carrier protein